MMKHINRGPELNETTRLNKLKYFCCEKVIVTKKEFFLKIDYFQL